VKQKGSWQMSAHLDHAHLEVVPSDQTWYMKCN
jgi:hypothetical protein